MIIGQLRAVIATMDVDEVPLSSAAPPRARCGALGHVFDASCMLRLLCS